MGRSSASCFKIIACGGSTESVDRDDMDASSENKGSDKRGWSFRKRSARHRVLSNTVVTETPSSMNKESSEPLTINAEAPVSSAISEKNSGIQWTEEIPLSSNLTTKDTTVLTEKTSAAQWTEEMPRSSTSTTMDSKVPAMVNEAACEDDDIKCGFDPDESVIIVIQAAVRGFMAQRELVRHKNVVKLQAAVRGHLVRNHAVGTLRCVQAIVKMQALVRSRHANLSTQTSSVEQKEVENSRTEPRPTSVIEKLLGNSFARQLMESTPTKKQINIKCDPSRSDSAWKWLERWMSVSSPQTVEPHEPEQVQLQTVSESINMKPDAMEAPVPSEGKEKPLEEKLQPLNKYTQDSHENSDFLNDETIHSNTGAQIEVNSSGSEKLEPEIEQTVTPSDHDSTDIIKSGVEEAAVQSEQTSDLIIHGEEKPQTANTYITDSKENSDLLPDETSHLSSGAPMVVNSSDPDKDVSEIEVPKRSAKRLATEQADSEGRKSVFGSKKASNPAFIAAQSRFEELTSKTNSFKSANSFNEDNAVTSHADTTLSVPENAIETKDIEPTEGLVSHGPRVSIIAGSECGTELSITSTLDSPDESEIINMKFEDEAKDNNEEADDVLNVEEHSLLGTELTISVLPEKHENGDGDGEKLKPANSVDIPEAKEQKLEDNASPRSHITIPESQGTPSSQLSTNNKKTKSDKKVSSSQKRKSWTTSKKSPIRSTLDSGLRSSLENLPKEIKPVKRRNYLGSPKPDQDDQEARDSSSSNPLPSYMQATESAKAKALANSSPRSSPDVQDKEIYVKKRHSLPGAVNGRHSSPRIQRSMSQAQPSTKGNDTNVTEKKWQR